MTTNYYDGIASGYNELYGDEQTQKLQCSLRFFDSSCKTVLDVGCGTGISTYFWKDMYGLECTGIDPSKGLLSQCTRKDVTLLQGFGESLPFADNSFDLVVSFSALQNFSDIQQGLLEMKRVSRKKVILSVMNRGNNFDTIKDLIQNVFDECESISVKNDTIFSTTV